MAEYLKTVKCVSQLKCVLNDQIPEAFCEKALRVRIIKFLSTVPY